MLPKFVKDVFVLRSRKVLPVWLRVLLCVIAIVVAVPLVVAANLRPDAKGYGTHQQLGLAACTFQKQMGIPCPSCGMTTSWSHMVRLQWQQSLQANAAGAILAILASFTVIWCGLASATGRFWIIQPTDWLFLSWVIGMTAFILAHWAYKCFL